MPAKQILIAACTLVMLGGGVANAGPCNTGQTTGMSGGNKAAQEAQRQEHAQPSVAEQPTSAGKTGQSGGEQAAVPSSKMTDTDHATIGSAQGSEPSSKMADQGC
jgi:hypothetical protein